ncbi:hypothetical protein B0H67DRAFT_248091 [Lasiosphaeris hirsuta]|uniref:Uncharacterized protein n=1 Tax=Lasiosphaeris hirsuta TaxID=260670 RepID=A0AA40AH29_9PEZI|nr:hypothetical protein B0H67DRAFT_248091 [Lasiosphaeris hirsuta]
MMLACLPRYSHHKCRWYVHRQMYRSSLHVMSPHLLAINTQLPSRPTFYWNAARIPQLERGWSSERRPGMSVPASWVAIVARSGHSQLSLSWDKLGRYAPTTWPGPIVTKTIRTSPLPKPKPRRPFQMARGPTTASRHPHDGICHGALS